MKTLKVEFEVSEDDYDTGLFFLKATKAFQCAMEEAKKKQIKKGAWIIDPSFSIYHYHESYDPENLTVLPKKLQTEIDKFIKSKGLKQALKE